MVVSVAIVVIGVGLALGIGIGLYVYWDDIFVSSPSPPHSARRYVRRTYNPKNTDQVCMICSEDSNKEDFVLLMACMHLFHEKCINELRRNRPATANKCPICGEKNIGHIKSQ